MYYTFWYFFYPSLDAANTYREFLTKRPKLPHTVMVRVWDVRTEGREGSCRKLVKRAALCLFKQQEPVTTRRPNNTGSPGRPTIVRRV